MSIELKDKLVTLESLGVVYDSEVNDRNAAIAAEATARAEAISAETAARTEAIANEVTARNAAIVEAINQAETGAPTKVELVSQMTDPDKNYLYIGEEQGYNSGHIYYLVDGAPVDKGVFGGTNIDNTLTISGQAADAKVTGDKIEEIKEDLSAISDSAYTGVCNMPLGELIANRYIDVTGNVKTYNGWSMTGYIALPAEAGTIQINAVRGSNGKYNAFYDENNAFVDSFEYQNGITDIEIPAGAKYARLSGPTDAMETLVMVAPTLAGIIDGQLKANLLPTYFEENLKAKMPLIIANVNGVGSAGITFVFITDLHWKNNYKLSPALVSRVLDATNVRYTICGGDILTQGKDKNAECETYFNCVNSFRCIANDGFFPVARGNHDDNSNWSESADISAYSFDAKTLYALLVDYNANRITMFGTNWNFYFVDASKKTYFIFIDTKRNGLVVDVAPIVSMFKQIPDGYHAIVVMHFVCKNEATLFAGCDLVSHIVKAYNEREQGTYTGAYQEATYDFTNAEGHIDLIIGGHMHTDISMSTDDVNNPAGVPIIVTDTDSYQDHSGVAGTVNSQCFDVVTINYNAKTVKCVRVGRGENREFTY